MLAVVPLRSAATSTGTCSCLLALPPLWRALRPLAFQIIGFVGLDKACELAWLLIFRSEKSVPPTECCVDGKSAPLC